MIAGGIAAVLGGADARPMVLAGQLSRLGEIGHEPVTLRVDVRCNVVRDLAGQVADAGAAVERGIADPQRAVSAV